MTARLSLSLPLLAALAVLALLGPPLTAHAAVAAAASSPQSNLPPEPPDAHPAYGRSRAAAPGAAAPAQSPANGQCAFVYGSCPASVNTISPLLSRQPIRLGLAGGSNGLDVRTPAQARSVFSGSVAPGQCNPISQLLAQQLTAKLNSAQGATGRPRHARTVSDADTFLARNNWRSAGFTGAGLGDWTYDVRQWTRSLRTFNLGAVGAGRCGTTRRCDDECAAFELEAERMRLFPMPLLPPVRVSPAPGRSARYGTLGASSASDPPVRGNVIPAMDVSKLGYTARDLERWDSYDYAAHVAELGPGVSFPQITQLNTMFTPLVEATTPGGEPSAGAYSGTSTPWRNEWQRAMGGGGTGLVRTFYPSLYARLREWNSPTSSFSILDQLYEPRGTYHFWPHDVHLNMSLAVNQYYNLFRAQTKAALRAGFAAQRPKATSAQLNTLTNNAFDAQTIDWLNGVAGIPGTVEWLSNYTLRHLSFQQTDPSHAAFGSWTLANPDLPPSDPRQWNLNDFWWQAGDIGHLYGHWLHLLPDGTIRALRNMAGPALTAMDRINTRIGQYDQTSTAQWIIRTTGYNALAFVLKRSETVLRARSAWLPSDEITSTNRDAGVWTTPAAIAFAEDRAFFLLGRLRKVGLSEYLGAHQGLSMQYLEQAMMHAASGPALDAFNQVYMLLWADLALNYHPGSNSFSGPSSRSYDLVTGTHNVADRRDLPMYVEWAERAFCAQGVPLYDGTGSGQLISTSYPSSLCHINSLTVQARSGSLVTIVERDQASFWHAAGHLYAPLDLLRNDAQLAPYRTLEQRLSAVSGHERSNFISPYLQMGFSGEREVHASSGVFACARLAGAAAAGAPTAIDVNGPTYVTPFVRLMTEMCDTPFFRTWALATAGTGKQVLARQVAVQHQAFMLVTQYLSASRQTSAADLVGPWNTDLILPLSVDEIWCDSVRLPIAAGSAYTIPPDAIITVRHRGASVAVRLLRGETSPNITAATSAAAYSGPISMDPGVGMQPYTLMWQVDAQRSVALTVPRTGHSFLAHVCTSLSDQIGHLCGVSFLIASSARVLALCVVCAPVFPCCLQYLCRRRSYHSAPQAPQRRDAELVPHRMAVAGWADHHGAGDALPADGTAQRRRRRDVDGQQLVAAGAAAGERILPDVRASQQPVARAGVAGRRRAGRRARGRLRAVAQRARLPTAGKRRAIPRTLLRRQR